MTTRKNNKKTAAAVAPAPEAVTAPAPETVAPAPETVTAPAPEAVVKREPKPLLPPTDDAKDAIKAARDFKAKAIKGLENIGTNGAKKIKGAKDKAAASDALKQYRANIKAEEAAAKNDRRNILAALGKAADISEAARAARKDLAAEWQKARDAFNAAVAAAKAAPSAAANRAVNAARKDLKAAEKAAKAAEAPAA